MATPVGIEIEEAYCEIAARRLAQETLDFDSPAPVETVTAGELL